jgi:hypothetical protein
MSRRSNLFGVGIVSASLPAWADYTALPVGRFIEFTTNTPDSIGMQSNTITNWACGDFVPDYGVRGAVGYHGGGDRYNWVDSSVGGNGQSGVYVLDCDTRAYSRKCYPQTAHFGNILGGGGSPVDAWGAYTDDGSPQSNHTWNCISHMPAAWGGGSNGSLMRVAKTGGQLNSGLAPGYSATWKFDLSSATHSAASPSISNLTGTGTYHFGGDPDARISDAPMACIDHTRQGWWATHRNSASNGWGGKMAFTSKTGVISPAVGQAHNFSWSTLHHFADDDIVVCITDTNYDTPAPAEWGIRVWQANTNDAWVQIPSNRFNRQTITDTMSWGGRAGMLAYPYIGEVMPRWSSILGCFVGLDVFYPYGSNAVDGKTTTIRVWKITPPPAGQRFSGTWQATYEYVTAKPGTEATNFMVHVNGGATGSDDGVTNGSWGRFVECPSLRAFVWTRSIYKVGQLVRLQGM